METKQVKRKRSWITFSIIIVIAVIGAFLVYSQKQDKIKELALKNDSVKKVLAQCDSVVNELVGAFDEIEANLDSISLMKNKLVTADKLTGEGSKKQKDRIVQGIKQLNLMLEANSQKITVLESKLKKSGVSIDYFKSKMAKLNHNIEVQNTQIAQLKQAIEDREFTISAMNKKLVAMEDEISVTKDSLEIQKETVKEKEDELNKAYVALGTYKELKEKGLLAKEGGFLNIGGSKTIERDFDENYFIPLDKRKTTEIPLFSKKAQVISEHPDSSYRFIKQDGLITALEIENPEEFWKISKYALIEIK